MRGVLGRAALAAVSALALALASACSPERSPETAAVPSPARTAPAAEGGASAEVERRLSRLKAELAITPDFCSLEDRRCRTAKRPVIERGIDALLARCGGKPRRQFDRCLQAERASVLAEIAPAADPS